SPRRCAYPPPAQSPGQCARASDPDRARHWLPLLHQSVLSHAAQLAHGSAMAAGDIVAGCLARVPEKPVMANSDRRVVAGPAVAAVANAPPAAPVTAGHPNTTSATRRLMGIAVPHHPATAAAQPAPSPATAGAAEPHSGFHRRPAGRHSDARQPWQSGMVESGRQPATGAETPGRYRPAPHQSGTRTAIFRVPEACRFPRTVNYGCAARQQTPAADQHYRLWPP